MSIWFVDPTKATQLHLRKGVVPAPVIAVLAALTQVEKLAEVAGNPLWWQVQVALGGGLVTGFVNAHYLSALTKPAPVADAPALPASLPVCHLKPSKHRRRDDVGQAFPLDEPEMPARTTADPATTLAIIRWLEPDKSSHARYKAAGGKTYCNIYAYDFCQRMQVFLPRVWWTSNAIVSLSQGNPVPVAYAKTVHELNANALHDWFEDYGPGFGWQRVFTATDLQDAANAGKVCIIVAKRKDANQSGHIVAVVPETKDLAAARDAKKQVLRPVQSQAGSENFTAKVPATQWWTQTRFRSFGFWVHG